MEHSFKNNLYQKPEATLSMGHEAFGLWLTEEVSSDHSLVDKLLKNCLAVKNKRIFHYQHTGREFVLNIETDNVVVAATLLNIDFEQELPEDTDFYDDESYAECGLDDFVGLLQAWLVFILDKRF